MFERQYEFRKHNFGKNSYSVGLSTKKKIDIGAVEISDDTYLKKISDTKPKKKKQLRMHWKDENEEEEQEKALLLEGEEKDDEEQQDMSPQEKIVSYWRLILPPTEEKDIKQTWCACTYLKEIEKYSVS